MVKKTVKSTMN